MKHDIAFHGISVAAIGFSIANLNAILTTILLCGNIGYLFYKWNRKRKEK